MANVTEKSSDDTLEVVLARVDALVIAADQQQAIRILHDEIPEKFSSDVAAYFHSGERLTKLRCFDEADDIFRQGYAKFPENPWLFRSYALVAASRGDGKLAFDRFSVLREKFPGLEIAGADIAAALVTLGRLDEAEEVVSAARQTFPNNRWVAVQHAIVADVRGDIAKALERWQAVRASWPEHYTIPGEVRALCRLSRLAEASDLLITADGQVTDPQLWVNAADLAEKAGAWSFAAAWWERFRTARPDDERGYVRGALALLRSGDTAAARALLELARVRWPDSAALGEVEREVTPPDSQEPAPSVPAKKPEPPRSGGLFGWLGW